MMSQFPLMGSSSRMYWCLSQKVSSILSEWSMTTFISTGSLLSVDFTVSSTWREIKAWGARAYDFISIGKKKNLKEHLTGALLPIPYQMTALVLKVLKCQNSNWIHLGYKPTWVWWIKLLKSVISLTLQEFWAVVAIAGYFESVNNQSNVF